VDQSEGQQENGANPESPAFRREDDDDGFCHSVDLIFCGLRTDRVRKWKAKMLYPV
jgi:hypothetical protein